MSDRRILMVYDGKLLELKSYLGTFDCYLADSKDLICSAGCSKEAMCQELRKFVGLNGWQWREVPMG